MDFSPVLGVHAGEHFDEGGFTRAVFPHQRVDLPFPQGEVHVLKGAHTREVFADAAHFQHDAVLHKAAPPFFKYKHAARLKYRAACWIA